MSSNHLSKANRWSNWLKYFSLIFLFNLAASFAEAQTAQRMSLQQAIDYALQFNPSVQNALLDVEIARKKVLETAAIGIPQVNATFDYTGQPLIPTTVVPNFVDPAGPPLEFRMGISHTANMKVNANWLLADGTYFLGLNAAKRYVELSNRIKSNVETETRANVTQAYYTALLSTQTLIAINANIETLQKSYEQVAALHANGLAEKIDVSRLSLQLNNLKVQKQKLENQKEMAHRMLKQLMGMDVETPLELSDDLKNLMVNMQNVDTSAKANPVNRPEYKVLEQNQVLNNMNVKRYQMGYLPSLSAFGSHQQNTFATENNFSDLGNIFYGGTMWGLQLRVPIFSGFQRHAQVQQARLETVKTRNEMNNLTRVIQNDVNQSRNQYITALKNVEIQKESFDLSKDIQRIAQAKYSEGVGSSLELTTANGDLLQAETNYLAAIYELLVAEMQYKKSLGQINR